MKSKVYSFRLTEEAITQIETMEGRTLTEKLENLIFKCCLEVPAKEKELAKLNEKIGQAKYELDAKIYRQEKAISEISKELNKIGIKIHEELITTSKPT